MTISLHHIRKVGRDRRARRSALLRLPSFLRRTGVPPVYRRATDFFPLPALALSFALFLITACSTPGPRVIEVSDRTLLQDVSPADAKEYYGYDIASLFPYVPQDLPIEDQREEFYVRWTPATISLVKFEYRQVAKPAEIFEKTYAPHGDMVKLFEIRGEEFRSGGSVSAWRVTLWNGDQLVTEKKSFLW